MIVEGLSGLVRDNRLSLSGYLRQCAYLGVSMAVALAAVGLKDDAASVADLLLVPTTQSTETEIAQWYDWGDWWN